jgi:hypothetical protein
MAVFVHPEISQRASVFERAGHLPADDEMPCDRGIRQSLRPRRHGLIEQVSKFRWSQDADCA